MTNMHQPTERTVNQNEKVKQSRRCAIVDILIWWFYYSRVTYNLFYIGAMMYYTRHASVRSQQRNIPPMIVEWLQQYGKEVHDHKGAMIYYFDKSSIRELEKTQGKAIVKKLESHMRTYIVVSCDTHSLITVGHNFTHKRLDS